MSEPLWRTVLCWSAVVTFFTAPFVVFILHVVAIERGWNIGQRWGEFAGLGTFYQTIAALVFGLSGLHSFDRFVQQKNGIGRHQFPSVKPVSLEQPKSKRSD